MAEGEPTTFTEQQTAAIQAKLDSGINAVLGKVKGLLEQHSQATEAKFAEIAKLVKPAEPHEPATTPGPKDSQELLDMKRQLAAFEKREAELRQNLERAEGQRKAELINRHVTAALATANVIAPEEALAVLRAQHEVRVNDDGTVRIIDGDGLPQLPADFVGTWLKTRPHMVRPAAPGTGPGGRTPADAAGGKALTPADVAKMTDADLEKLLATGITVPAGSAFRDEITFKSLPPDSDLQARRAAMGLKNVV